jgi:hypothetical protein
MATIRTPPASRPSPPRRSRRPQHGESVWAVKQTTVRRDERQLVHACRRRDEPVGRILVRQAQLTALKRDLVIDGNYRWSSTMVNSASRALVQARRLAQCQLAKISADSVCTSCV